MTLPNCNCEACQAAVAYLARPTVVMSVAEARRRNEAYAAYRRQYKIDHPPVPKELCDV